MSIKLKRLVVPIPSPLERLDKTVKKANFLKEVLTNQGSLTNAKLKQISKDTGWGARPQEIIKDEEIQVILKPVTDQLIELRLRIIEALNQKDFSNERTTDLIDSMDKLTKNIQLLTGGETEKHKVVFGWDTGEQSEQPLLMENETNNQLENANQNPLLPPQLGLEAPQLSPEVESLRVT